MRLFHTSDWHLGQSLHGQERDFEHACFLDWLLGQLRLRQPDALLIAGDIFDTVNPPAAKELLPPILPHLDLFCPRRTEAAVLTGESDPKKMVAAFRQHMPRGLIAIKLDAEGCYLDDGNQTAFCPAYKVDVVDTTGAGDSWFGGLMVALQKKMPLDQAGRFANRVAADCCGCERGGMATAVPADEADSFMEGLGCTSDVACPDVDVCDADDTPRCLGGRCMLEAGNGQSEPGVSIACGHPDLAPCPDGMQCVLNSSPTDNAGGLGVCEPL